MVGEPPIEETAKKMREWVERGSWETELPLPKQGGHNRARSVNIAERRAQALQLRRAGADYRAIAAAMGVTVHVAWNDVQRGLKAIIQEPAEDVRQLELERVDRLFMVAYQKALAGDLKAIDTCLRIMDRRAKLLGLDVPQKVDLTAWVVEFGRQQGLDPGTALETARAIVKQLDF